MSESFFYFNSRKIEIPFPFTITAVYLASVSSRLKQTQLTIVMFLFCFGSGEKRGYVQFHAREKTAIVVIVLLPAVFESG